MARAQAGNALVELRTERARLDGKRQRVKASAEPVRYLATMRVMDTEEAVRWLILLRVLCCDPTAIVLMVTAARR
jgi:hypothetical protein